MKPRDAEALLLEKAFPKVTVTPLSSLNTTLKPSGTEGGGRIRIVPLNDIQVGSPGTDYDLLRGTIKYILKNPGTYALGLGDYINGTVHFSRGHPSPYSDTHNLTEQYSTVRDLFRPLAGASKIIGLIAGNHDSWLKDEKGLDIVGILSDELSVPYLQDGCLITCRVGKNTYQIYARHGAGSSMVLSTKVAAMVRQTQGIVADLYVMGHHHEVMAVKQAHFINGQYRKSYLVMSGSFEKWEGSYAQAWGAHPSVTGVPKIKLYAGEWDIHIGV